METIENKNEESIFSNIPERDNSFEKVEGPRLPKKTYIYLIEHGKSTDEFYSFVAPIVSDEHVSLDKAFKKGVVSESLFKGEIVEEYFRTSESSESMSFDLDSGVLITRFDANQIPWLSQNAEDAKNKLKDLVIVKYQQIMPNLLDKLTDLETRLKQTSTQQVPRQQNRRQTAEDDLLNL